MILLFETAGLIAWGGVFIIALLVFAETGLLLGLIIPGGETLVFTAGLLVSTGTLDISIITLLIILILTGFAGDTSGYFIGKKFGRRLYHKEDSWYFKKTYLRLAESFFKKHKRSAILFGKFFPVIRPFSPIISGTTSIPSHTFFPLSGLACTLYMTTFSLLGYFLGSRFPVIKNYLGWILPITIVITLIPVIIQIRKHKKAERHTHSAT